jgi:putative ABC transport system substrate-binding protein
LTAAFVQRLRERHWIEGRNVMVEYRWAEGRNDLFAAIAEEFARLNVDLIVTYGTAPVIAAKTGNVPNTYRICGGWGSGRCWSCC